MIRFSRFSAAIAAAGVFILSVALPVAAADVNGDYVQSVALSRDGILALLGDDISLHADDYVISGVPLAETAYSDILIVRFDLSVLPSDYHFPTSFTNMPYVTLDDPGSYIYHIGYFSPTVRQIASDSDYYLGSQVVSSVSYYKQPPCHGVFHSLSPDPNNTGFIFMDYSFISSVASDYYQGGLAFVQGDSNYYDDAFCPRAFALDFGANRLGEIGGKLADYLYLGFQIRFAVSSSGDVRGIGPVINRVPQPPDDSDSGGGSGACGCFCPDYSPILDDILSTLQDISDKMSNGVGGSVISPEAEQQLQDANNQLQESLDGLDSVPGQDDMDSESQDLGNEAAKWGEQMTLPNDFEPPDLDSPFHDWTAHFRDFWNRGSGVDSGAATLVDLLGLILNIAGFLWLPIIFCGILAHLVHHT